MTHISNSRENIAASGISPFTHGRVGRATLVALPSVFAPLAERLATHETLYAWAEEAPQARALQGRGVVYVAELEESGIVAAVRHSWHGGLFAPLTGDRFLAPTRAPREAVNNLRLRSFGIPTPELLGYALYPAGPLLRRVDVVSRFIPGGWDFGAVLSRTAPGIDRDEGSAAIMPLLAQLATAGAVHPDLNVKNILLVRDERRELVAWVLDVDVATFSEQGAEQVMSVNVQRLMRSIRKWHHHHELPLDAQWFADFERSAIASVKPMPPIRDVQ